MGGLLNRIDKIFKGATFDAVLVMNTGNIDSNFHYITEFTSGIFEGTFLIALPKEVVLLVNQLEYETAKRQKQKGMKIIKIDSSADMKKYLKKHLKNKIVGINGDFLPYTYYRKIKQLAKPKKMVDASRNFEAARSIKDADEISKMAKANKIIKSAINESRGYLKEGMTESEFASLLVYLMMKKGASGPSFETIVCFGESSALPHHLPDDTRLKPNSIVLIDAGARYKNYCSDVTRTFVFKPDKKSAKHKKIMEIYYIVKKAQKLGLDALKPGIDGSTVHKKVAAYIDNAANGKYKGRFIHSLGHAVGIDVHDNGPGLSLRTEILKQNMVVSVEPGIYVVGFGGVRIEDDALITKSGARFL